MAATFDYFPFDSGLGANSMESRWREMMMYMKSSGIIVRGTSMDTTGDDCAVSAGTGMQVEISVGEAWIRGHMFIHTGDPHPMPISSNSSGSDRTDLVVVRGDFTANTIQYVVLEDTTVPIQSATVWDIVLAEVTVPDGASDASAFTITDLREFAIGGNSLVPSIRRSKSSSQVVTSGSFQDILLDTTDRTTMPRMVHPTIPEIIVIPQDGFYTMHARIQFGGATKASGGSRRALRIMKNGVTLMTVNQVYDEAQALDLTGAWNEPLESGDQIILQGFQDSGNNVTCSNPRLVVHYTGPDFVSA